jgi:hypothetical protein
MTIELVKRTVFENSVPIENEKRVGEQKTKDGNRVRRTNNAQFRIF